LQGVKWIDRDTAEVEVQVSFQTRFGGEGRTDLYRVVRKDGQWTVAKVTNRAIS
jgi:hypothetical protein